MKVLFLDVDGVLNHTTFIRDHARNHNNLFAIDPEKVILLQEIVFKTDCKIVLSSTWRHSTEGVAVLLTHLRAKDLDIWSAIPKFCRSRARAIKSWLGVHEEVTHFAILDDDGDANFGEGFFQTHMDTGLTEGVVDAVVAHLQKG